ncbi:MAG TPA: YetF domain-containing protein [Geothrix sp.]|nr:YetF domain-containing protein [Geothrix sp.]
MFMVAMIEGALPVGASMWKLAQPWWEFVLRGLLVYGFLLITLRLTGKRQVGQLAPFDLVLLLVLSNALQNSMNAGDNTVTAGFVLVGTLLAVNGLMSWLTWRSKKAELLVEGRPQILVHHGVLDEGVLASERITRHELMAAVRQAGIVDLKDVHVAILETNGRINVIAKGVSAP